MEVNFFWILVYRMPRKAKITAVPVDDQPDLTLKTVVGEEPKTDAEKMTDILNEVNVAEQPPSIEDAAPAAPKTKARRASKKEPVFTEPEEPEVEVTSSLDEVQAEVVLPKQVSDSLAHASDASKSQREVEPKVACPDCGKQVSAKTLKYSHRANCVIKKQKPSHIEVERKVDTPPEQEYQNRAQNK